MSVIDFEILYISSPDKAGPLAGGKLFVGEPDLDPIANQKQLNVVQEDGTVVPISQPMILSAGGVPTYNGSTVRLDVDGNYSIKILDKNDNQKYFIDNVFEGEPVTFEDLPDINPVWNFDTLNDPVISTDTNKLYDGAALNLKERTAGNGGGAMWDVVLSSTVTENTHNIVQCTGVGTLSLVLRDIGVKSALQYGAVNDGVTDSSDALIALKTGGGNIEIEPGDYVIHKNWILEDDTYVSASGATFLATDTWVDQTSGNSVNKRGVVLIAFVDNVEIIGLNVDTAVTVSSEATTPYMIRGSNDILLDNVSGTHADSRTITCNPFDIEGTNTNITIQNSYFKNTTGAATGLCNIRNVSSGTLTKNIKILNCVFDKDSGDEVLAVYGVLGKTTDVIIDGNTFNSSSATTHGAFISIFPLVNDPTAEVNNVRFTNNTVISTGFIDSVLRVGSTPDLLQTCDNIFIENNNFVIANALITSLIIRFIQNVGSNVVCNGNTFSQVGTDSCQALIAGPWRTSHANVGTIYAKQLFESCPFVTSNVMINPASNGVGFYNCERVADNKMQSERGARIEAAEMTSEISGNKFTITGSGSSYVLNSNDLGTARVPTFIFKNNDVETTNVTPLTSALSLDTGISGINVCFGNTFRGVSPDDVFAGVNNSFSILEGNEWWDYTDMTSDVSPFRSVGYNKMTPKGNFVTSSAINASTGSVVIGWTKAEVNGLGADWKAVEATIL